ncbi:MAG: TetR/AcrR family transcriptional regulator [Hyphomonadaceae bacterium]|nr:TetR/AcrR family transcriptional regulator [Hyphomonadaceae bacterium]
MEALTQAASELFGQLGPEAVSVRDVASKADVNHALVHRHFGTKENLLQAVLDEHALAFRAAMLEEDDFGATLVRLFDVAKERPAFTMIVAQLLLGGDAPNAFVAQEGGLRVLADRIADGKAKEDVEAALVVIAASAALNLGWHLFGPFIVHALDYKGDPAKIERGIREIMGELAEKLPQSNI